MARKETGLDTIAVSIGGASLVSLFYGLTGLLVRKRATPERIEDVVREGAEDRGWQRVQSNAFETSVKRPWLLTIGGLVGLVTSIVMFVAAVR